MDIETIVADSVKHNAGDLHLCGGYSPFWRCSGELIQREEYPLLSDQMLISLSERWLTALQREGLQREGQVDFVLSLADGTRLRGHFFYQRAGLSLALRVIPAIPPQPETLLLPAGYQQWLALSHGLILVTGATGSGKSTTLAALIETLNCYHSRHIITLEDPIEFIHRNQHALIQQRQIGEHCRSFAAGLRAALREDPDVILLGELRDTETIRLALTAAETGHLVLATLHSRTASSAIDQLVDVFNAEEKLLVRAQLAASLQVVIAQRLVKALAGGRVALYEVLINTPAVANLIREGKCHQLPAQLQIGAQQGMQTFAQSEQRRREDGLIT
ncbi:MAG: putative protein YggR [Candidatus Erwinia impunctatus]|nr:putative protein YggR [Culicoides impunctatus]